MPMERNAMGFLLEWKNREDRKPLILKGARQTGKTWLMKDFGRRCYEDTAYFNFDEDDGLKELFRTTKDPFRLLELLGLIHEKRILPEKTLVFDEVQECPEALNSLKYFREKAGEYHIMAAGSLLGTYLAEPKSYPVGQVDLLSLHPLSFAEFLQAVDPGLATFRDGIHGEAAIPEIFHNRLLEACRLYLIIGGMPECVASWIAYRDAGRINAIQKNLLALYENDFTKHNRKINAARILMVYRSIIPQLAKENQKFSYGTVKPGARAREFEEAVEWLVSAGIANRIYNVSSPQYPLKSYARQSHFKLFFLDTGLLKAMAEIDNEAIILRKDFSFRGVLAENFVLQQFLSSSGASPYYYAPDSRHEIDLLLQHNMEVLPVEIKAGTDKNAASFKSYLSKYRPQNAIRYSERNFRRDGAFVNIPLYLAGRMDLLSRKDASQKETR